MPGQELTDQRLVAACEVIVLGQFGITLMGRTARLGETGWSTLSLSIVLLRFKTRPRNIP